MKRFSKWKINKKLLLRDVVAQGPSKSRSIKNADGFLLPRSMVTPRVKPSANRGFPWGWALPRGFGLVTEKRKARYPHVWARCLDGGNVAAVYSNLNRQAGGGGACMHGQKNEHKQYINLTLNDTDAVGDGGEDARGEARSPNRWAATSNTSSIQ